MTNAADALADKIEQWLATQPKRSAGNKTVRTMLDIQDADYWLAHRILIDADRAVRARGKGGSIKLVSTVNAPPPTPVSATPTTPTTNSPTTPLPADESGWYDTLASVLRTTWSQEQGFDEVVVEVTARQGRRDTGGKWTRPDIAVVAIRRTKYVPRDDFHVWTFEVKRGKDLDVTAVYEALAHSRAATRAAVLACFDGPLTSSDEDSLDVVTREAIRHGVGVYAIVWPGTFDDWDVIVEADVFQPGMGALDEFIGTQLPAHRSTIENWHK